MKAFKLDKQKLYLGPDGDIYTADELDSNGAFIPTKMLLDKITRLEILNGFEHKANLLLIDVDGDLHNLEVLIGIQGKRFLRERSDIKKAAEIINRLERYQSLLYDIQNKYSYYYLNGEVIGSTKSHMALVLDGIKEHKIDKRPDRRQIQLSIIFQPYTECLGKIDEIIEKCKKIWPKLGKKLKDKES